MRRTLTILGTTSIIALTLAATPAAAQDTAPADPAVEAQTNPADTVGPPQADAAVQTAAGADQAADDSEAIVVTGLRRSLQSAKNIKRNSEQIVDAIVAEDIGKLPDIAVSETAARIPGVQVTRRGGEADTVLVRGLPDFATTYNGREIFTAETRVVALQDFPSANIAALEVFKTSTADLVEAGLAGLVNVRSRRPFDFKGFEIAGSVWALRSKQAGKWNPNANFLVSNRWDVGDGGEFGALLNVSYTELDYLDSEPSNTDFIAPGPSASRFPDIQRLFYRSGNRVRPSLNAAIQYRPTPDLEIYAEALYQGFRNKIDDRLFAQPLYGGSSYTNLVLRDGTDLLSSGTVTNPVRGDGFQGGTFNKTDTYQFAFGGRYDAGPLQLTADFARTTSRFKGSTESVDFALRSGVPYSVDFDNETPEFALNGIDLTDPANFVFRGLYEEDQLSKGDDYQARLDAVYESGIDFLPKIEAGVRYSDRDAHREFGNRYANFESRQLGIAGVPLDYQLFRAGFRGTDVQSGFRNYLSPTYNSIRSNRDALRAFVIGLGARDFGFGTFTADPPSPNPDSVYDATEKTSSAYLQGQYKIGDIVDGVIGIRAVKTKTGVAGTGFVEGVPTPIDRSNSYTDWLPNASARFHLTRDLQLRLSATQTRTRPTFGQLNPSLSIGSPIGVCVPGGDPFACRRVGNGGNPDLAPLKSDNYDASLEYYFAPTGFISGAIFRRDLDGFIQNQTTRTIDPDFGPLEINRPINTGRGRIDGAELQFTTFFDFEFVPRFFRNFGAQANVTYLDAKTGFPDSNGDVTLQRILGVSKWTYNLVAMYEAGGLSARLSYNKRGKTLETIQDRGNDLYFEEGRPAGRLDLSTSYTFNDNLTVFADWTNILEKPYRQNFSSARDGAARAEYVRFLRYEETIYSLGLRFRFGGDKPPIAEPAPVMAPPPPPPVVEPAPVIEPAPPPPPPPPSSGERG